MMSPKKKIVFTDQPKGQTKDDIARAQREERSQRQTLKRNISSHVISRWYRPPEIILTEKTYGQAVDMWSLGCVLAEMLHCTTEYKNSRQPEKRFFIPGTSCFPLSPCAEMLESKRQDVNIVSNHDQLKMILEKLGKQDENDSSFLT